MIEETSSIDEAKSAMPKRSNKIRNILVFCFFIVMLVLLTVNRYNKPKPIIVSNIPQQDHSPNVFDNIIASVGHYAEKHDQDPDLSINNISNKASDNVAQQQLPDPSQELLKQLHSTQSKAFLDYIAIIQNRVDLLEKRLDSLDGKLHDKEIKTNLTAILIETIKMEKKATSGQDFSREVNIIKAFTNDKQFIAYKLYKLNAFQIKTFKQLQNNFKELLGKFKSSYVVDTGIKGEIIRFFSRYIVISKKNTKPDIKDNSHEDTVNSIIENMENCFDKQDARCLLSSIEGLQQDQVFSNFLIDLKNYVALEDALDEIYSNVENLMNQKY